jgi:adenylate kinase
MRLLIMGPPGAGKGTQAAVVARRLGIPHISTGDIFRANVSEGTPLGIEAKRYMDAGEYVPDGVTNAMVRDRLTWDDCVPGFLLDGYPRTVEQVGELDGMLKASGTSLDRVIELTVDTDVVVGRLVKRAAEQTAPLIAVYDARGLVARVDGMGDVADVTSRMLAAIGVDG